MQGEAQGAMEGWIYSSFRGEPDMEEILPFFVDELSGTQAALSQFAQTRDIDNLRKEAHKLRGSAGGYGFQGLSDLAGRLEDSCKISTRDESMILRNVDELLDHLSKVRL